MPKIEFSDELRKEYELLFAQASVSPQYRLSVDAMLARIFRQDAVRRYEEVERQTKVPAHVVGITHAMEASCRFDGHLHNGDPLTARTVQRPPGHPKKGEPPFEWVDSAVDALTLKKLEKWTDWSPAGVAYALENYNGWGYRLYHPHVKSPYLWSFTSIYGAGKYVADGKWSDTAVSRQCGAMALLKRMAETGKIALPVVAAGEDEDEPAHLTFAEMTPVHESGAPPPAYPGRILKDGSMGDAVTAVQLRLATLGIQEVGGADGEFGERTERAVRIFQARSVDEYGDPLTIDGMVGPKTWAALFGPSTVGQVLQAAGPVTGSLVEAVLRISAGEIGVREEPPGSNRGKRVDEYLRSVAPTLVGVPWCMAFVYFCFGQAAAERGLPNPAPRTASVWGSWRAAHKMPNARIVLSHDARSDPTLIEPGMVFHIDTGGGTGHAGFVADIVDGRLVTVEGNTNDGGSREGIGVFARSSRSVASINLGFVAYD